MNLLSARLQAPTVIELEFDGEAWPALEQIEITPPLTLTACSAEGRVCTLTCEPVDLRVRRTVRVRDAGELPLLPDGVLDPIRTDAPLGCTVTDAGWTFRLFAPRAQGVDLLLFRRCDDDEHLLFAMTPSGDGAWHATFPPRPGYALYAFQVDGPRGPAEAFDRSRIIADPYARAVAARNTWRQEARALLPGVHETYDWEGDEPLAVPLRDLMISELHVRDATAHPSSGVPPWLAGTYGGLAVERARGGLAHLLRLGVNAVELLPLQHFAHREPPYRVPVEGACNTWNPYAANHWGYMTSYFFTPDPGFTSGAVTGEGRWSGADGRQVREFKDLVKTLHRHGLAVILDVVYNHTSHFDEQPLQRIDKLYYYRTDARGVYTSLSGCGNDFRTTRPMARRLIIDSALHWMREYHVDGFRFDLATMIDRETFEELGEAARRENPHVLLIAEPWGGGEYDLRRFSALGMGAWNDLFRNGVKGADPRAARGYVFGSWGAASPEDFGLWVLGSIRGKGGPFLDAAHAVNYLASHDGWSMGDFVRIACGEADPDTPVTNRDTHVALTPAQRRIHKLAALLLCASQGALMLEAGQEWARTKIIAPRDLPGITPGLMDHNSYEKDDETNWLNYEDAERNADLVEYYRGLLRLRAALPLLRHADPSAYRFLVPDAPIASGFIVGEGVDRAPVAVLVNANHQQPARYPLPDGAWMVLADGERSDCSPPRIVRGPMVEVPPAEGMVLKRIADC
jgi:pullulanase